MKLQNKLIIALGNSGLGTTTGHSLSGDSAYNAFRFRRSVMKAYQELGERQAALKKEAGDDEERFKELNAALLKDETEVWASPLPVKDYLLLASENKHTPLPGSKGGFIDYFRAFEYDLEGILWKDEEETTQQN